jgi:CDP-glycerol glycerophosphotransferase
MKLKENVVVCESFFGRNYSDSPKYVFEYLQKNYPGKYKFVWIFTEKKKLPYPAAQVKRFSLRYFYYLGRAKYFVFNVKQPLYFIKREGSIFLETWHGTPLKKLVFDMEEVASATALYKKHVYIESRCWDYLIAPNRFSSDVFKRAFMYEGTMLETGYPRNDILHMKDSIALVKEIKQELGIPEGKKVILYAPTWRDDEFHDVGQYKFTLHLDLELLREKLGEDYVVVLRTHYLITDALELDSFKGFAFNGALYDDIARLYRIADILITDYSSVFFDYANLKRPMLFFTYDLEKYHGVLRGLYIDMEEELPGPMLFTTEEIIEAIQNIDGVEEKYKEKYDTFYEKYCGWEDGTSTKKVVETVFQEIKEEKKK